MNTSGISKSGFLRLSSTTKRTLGAKAFQNCSGVRTITFDLAEIARPRIVTAPLALVVLLQEETSAPVIEGVHPLLELFFDQNAVIVGLSIRIENALVDADERRPRLHRQTKRGRPGGGHALRMSCQMSADPWRRAASVAVAAGRRPALAHLLQQKRFTKSWTNVVGGWWSDVESTSRRVLQREHSISSQPYPLLIAWSTDGEGSIGLPFAHMRSFQDSHRGLSASRMRASPSARASADCAARIVVTARAFPIL